MIRSFRHKGLRLLFDSDDRSKLQASQADRVARVAFDVDFGGLSLGGRLMPMKNPPHPGLSVKLDCLEPLNMTVTDGARVLGVSRKALSDLVNGHAGISPEMAIRLDKAFGGGAVTWHGLQATYDMALALQHADEITVPRVTAAA